MDEITLLKRKAVEIRKELLTMIYEAKTGHTGGALSSTDILTALYYKIMNVDATNPKWDDRDRFIQSKGHTVEPLWAILADKGFFPKEELKTFSQFGTRLIGHPNNKVPGIEVNTGALGHGLPVAVGMAIAAKLDNKSYKVFTIMGDGEQAEGSVWEGAMCAAQYKLDNLVAIVDRNRLQITGSTEDVMGLEPFGDKWRSFGWEVVEVDGNDMEQVVKVFSNIPAKSGKPTMVLANTTKGKGVKAAENIAGWHHRVPTEEEYSVAMKELDAQLEVLV